MPQSRQYNWKLSPQEPFKMGLQIFSHPAEYLQMDYHRALHFNLILKGGMSGRIGGNLFQYRKDDLQLTASWEIHGENRIPKQMHLLSIMVDPDLLLNSMLDYRERALALFLLPPVDRHDFLATSPIRKLVRKWGKKLTEIEGDNSSILKIRRWLAIQEFFAELMNLLRKSDIPVAPYHLYQKLSRAFELLRQNRPIALQEAADACSLSPSRFGHLFMEVCRIPFSAYELRNRLNRVAVRLRQGASVKVAAVEEGFFDSSHLEKHFLRQFGTTPGKFRC